MENIYPCNSNLLFWEYLVTFYNLEQVSNVSTESHFQARILNNLGFNFFSQLMTVHEFYLKQNCEDFSYAWKSKVIGTTELSICWKKICCKLDGYQQLVNYQVRTSQVVITGLNNQPTYKSQKKSEKIFNTENLF